MVRVEILVGSLPGYGVGGDLGREPTWVWCGWRSWWGAYLGMVWEEILVGSLPGYGAGGDLALGREGCNLGVGGVVTLQEFHRGGGLYVITLTPATLPSISKIGKRSLLSCGTARTL